MTQSLSKPLFRRTVGLMVAATVVTGATIFYGVSQFGSAQEKTPAIPAETTPQAVKITALGRLEPEAEVIRLSAPAALQNDRVAEVLVKQGDKVKADQVIAILDSRDRLQAALQQAEEQVKVAQAKLAQVRAGAKTGEISAQESTISRIEAEWKGDKATQEATIARLVAQWEGEKTAQEATIARIEAEVNNAEAEYERYLELYKEGAFSKSVFESKQLSFETTRQELAEAKATLSKINNTASEQLVEATATLSKINSTGNEQVEEAKATLDKIAEVRPVDLRIAQTELDSAIAAVKSAETELRQAYVMAPMAGQILKIHTKAGEKLSDDGIAELGQTDAMVAVAEVYQTDIGKVKVGLPVVITSQAFEGELKGKVSEVGLQVLRQNVFSDQPGENLDRKVVEVKVRLNSEDSKKVAYLTNLQVQVAIDVE